MTKTELRKALDDLIDERPEDGWGRTEWTYRIQKMLVDMGIDQGKKVCAGGVEGATWPTEWLYDMVWLQVSNDFNIENIGLVAEIEWGEDWEVLEDFQKLLQARADVRLIVFDHEDGLQEQLKRQIRKFKKSQPGDRYLFVSYVNAGRRPKFVLKEYVFPYLHEEMMDILITNGNVWMTVSKLAEKVNMRKMYRRKDRMDVPVNQIRARTAKYTNLFVREGDKVRYIGEK